MSKLKNIIGKNSQVWILGSIWGVLASFLMLAPAMVHPSFGALVILAPLPLLLSFLSQGFVIGTFSSLIAVFSLLFTAGDWSAATYFMLFAFPVGYLSRLALLSRGSDRNKEWYPVGRLVNHFTVIGFAFFLLVLAIVNIHHAPGLEDYLTLQINDALNSVTASTPEEQQVVAEFRQEIGQIVGFIPGLMILFWMMLLGLNTAIAHSLLKRFHGNIRPNFSMQNIQISSWWLLIFFACILWSFVPQSMLFLVARNFGIIVLFAFLMVGLSRLHQGIEKLNSPFYKGLLFTLLYLVLFMSKLALIAVIVVGLLDQCYRRYILNLIKKKEK